jgi:hypothetical protein
MTSHLLYREITNGKVVITDTTDITDITDTTDITDITDITDTTDITDINIDIELIDSPFGLSLTFEKPPRPQLQLFHFFKLCPLFS